MVRLASPPHFTSSDIIIELDKSRSTNKKSLLGGSLFSSGSGSVPSELASLVAPQNAISKLVLSTRTSINGANQDYDKLTDPLAAAPSPPVHAARLNGLLKTLANAEGAVAESIKARRALIEGLEKILSANRTALAADESQFAELTRRKEEIDAKKRDVEDSIMRGFSTSNPGTPAGAGNGSPAVVQSPTTPAPEPDRPEVEALTPPSFDALSPSGSPRDPSMANAEAVVQQDDSFYNDTQPAPALPPAPTPVIPGADLLSSLSAAYARPLPSNGDSVKKRKLNHGDDFPDLGGDAMDGLDDEVAEMLRNETGA